MKQCNKCDSLKQEDDFAWKSKVKSIRASTCKICHNEYSKKHYSENKDYYAIKGKTSSQAARSRNREYIRNYLLENPCVDCGENDIQVLEFDHIDMLRSNTGRVSQFMTSSLKTLKTEISKCEVRCGNCHIRRTRRQLGWHR